MSTDDEYKKIPKGFKKYNQYAERDAYTLGDYYVRHISAMTKENLHNKAAIAAELAVRDIEIDELTIKLGKERKEYLELMDRNNNLMTASVEAAQKIHKLESRIKKLENEQ